HVMPGAVLTGLVTVGRYATIGANATILPRIAIGSGAVIGAGATVTRDVAAGVTVAGNPARAMSRFGSEPV
ncbi:MAG TPA: DapH/DapD/GlmU-related protein, partial [Rhodanobacter sp.]|nr:DapH/DapD/GlmU-related protein [Rhodanobacter sp.]